MVRSKEFVWNGDWKKFTGDDKSVRISTRWQNPKDLYKKARSENLSDGERVRICMKWRNCKSL